MKPAFPPPEPLPEPEPEPEPEPLLSDEPLLLPLSSSSTPQVSYSFLRQFYRACSFVKRYSPLGHKRLRKLGRQGCRAIIVNNAALIVTGLVDVFFYSYLQAIEVRLSLNGTEAHFVFKTKGLAIAPSHVSAQATVQHASALVIGCVTSGDRIVDI